MSAAGATAPAARPGLGRELRLYLHQVRGEQLLYWRSREAAIFTFAFPIVLFVLLGAVYNGTIQGHPAGRYLLVGILGYGLGSTAFSGLAITVVVRRENGVLKRVRATPLPPVTYLGAWLTSVVIVFSLETIVLIAIARLAFGVGVPDAIGSVVVETLFGIVAFAALGVGVTGWIRSAEGSSGILNIILLPMAFLGGSFSSTSKYPAFLRGIAEVLPLTHFIRIVKGTILDGQAFWAHPWSILVVAGWAAFGVVAALRWFRWEPRST